MPDHDAFEVDGESRGEELNMQLQVIPLDFTSIVSKRWSSLPDIEHLKKQIATLVLPSSELHDIEPDLYAPPKGGGR
ncbi:hypothetical protein DF043_01775 [Burkholderia cepacia]|nr:hypothetical protein DF043_01775 [Burkholderia cepacia]